MIYLIKHTRNSGSSLSSKLKKFGLTVIIACFLILFISNTAFGRFALDGLILPALTVGTTFHKMTNWIVAPIKDKVVLQKTNEELLLQIAELRSRESDYGTIDKENIDFRSELGLEKDRKLFSASILAKPPQVPLDTFIINRGAMHGVKENMEILSSKRSLVGKVTNVSRSTSVVTLSSFPGVSSYGFVERTGENIEVKGQGGGGIHVDVPIDFDIKNNDNILSYGSFPSIIGVVAAVESNESSGLKSVLISLPQDIARIRVVFIESAQQ